MKFSVSALLMDLAAISSVAASPMPFAEVSVANQEVPRDVAVSTFAPQDDFEQLETIETRDLALTTDLEAPSTGLSNRATNSKFKVRVVNAAARILGIIIIDYTINLLPRSHESITANFDKLTNIRTNGPVVAIHFEGGANPLAAAQDAVLDFATSMASGFIDITLNAAGVATGVASSTGIHLGGTVVAKTLHVSNENNAKIGSINL
ncbi:hypothetical protein CGLO_03422 [Colletotrichum gloeosporioides Cg-14]|uniref:Uncharacterized protein n=1 Tax=Colletotrichum gloeosporioides (strain Cg-14) TaxID=1237896 RepID=T0M6M8_COLGC|nr:hypothetical protein CGLO_03422 [Colletotrichum gloeosporioides Cg-14]